MLHAKQSDIDRFMSYVDKLPNGCWFWTGGRSRGRGNKKWYGSFWLGHRTVRAHRFAHEVLGGHLPLGVSSGPHVSLLHVREPRPLAMHPGTGELGPD